MFTGIIETIGEVAELQQKGEDLRVVVRAAHWSWDDVAIGDSIATNGVCLTVVDLPGGAFAADVSNETLSLTTVGQWQLGQRVNLEKALTPQTRLGGHLVSGHVDGLGEVVKRYPDGRSERFEIRAPDQLAKYIAQKGSITVDGTSLTVNQVDQAIFSLNIVPHTLQNTVMGDYKTGSQVNLEVDVIARYLERLLMGSADHVQNSKLSESFLADHGYLK